MSGREISVAATHGVMPLLLSLVSLLSLLQPASPAVIINNCGDAHNCRGNSSCRGTCYGATRSRMTCIGQCESAASQTAAACKDTYHDCHSWANVRQLCSNNVVARVCKRSCNLCEDETVRPTCSRGFVCDRKCAPLTYLCDGVVDCYDRSDERNCNYLSDLWYTANGDRRCGVRLPHIRSVTYRRKSLRINRARNIAPKHNRHRTKRLVGAKHAQANSWPWMGLILGLIEDANQTEANPQLKTFCGATLVHPQWAVTAAHCVVKNGISTPLYNFEIYFGKHYVRAASRRERVRTQIRKPSKILLFKEYDEEGIYNDIALIMLNESVALNEFVNVICAPLSVDHSQFYKTGGVTSGWGLEHSSSSKVSNRLKQTMVKPMDRSRCTNEIFDLPPWYTYNRQIDNSLLCTEMDTENGFGVICDGDSGSPMVIRRFVGSYSLLGVASFGTDKNCSKPGEAAVYTNVYYFLPWISEFIDLSFI